MHYIKKHFNRFLFLVLIISSFASLDINAKPKWDLKVVYGHPETVNDKTTCVGFGICEVIIHIDLIKLQSLPKSTEAGEDLLVAGDVINGQLILTLKNKLDKRAINSDGKYIFPIYKDISIKGNIAKDFGYKKFTIPKGNYEFDGQKIIIPLNDIKPFESKDGKR